MVIAENGRRRRITKREAVIGQLVDKSAAADLRATKMLLDMLADIERQAAARTPETPHPNPGDLALLDALKARLRRLAEASAEKGAAPDPKVNGGWGDSPERSRGDWRRSLGGGVGGYSTPTLPPETMAGD